MSANAPSDGTIKTFQCLCHEAKGSVSVQGAQEAWAPVVGWKMKKRAGGLPLEQIVFLQVEARRMLEVRVGR